MGIRFKEFQIDALKSAFEKSQHLTKKMKTELVNKTGLDVEQITSWFNRNRAKKRAKKTVGDLEKLQQALQIELQESKKRENELRAENQDLKNQLAINVGRESSDSQLEDVFWAANGFNGDHSSC